MNRNDGTKTTIITAAATKLIVKGVQKLPPPLFLAVGLYVASHGFGLLPDPGAGVYKSVEGWV